MIIYIAAWLSSRGRNVRSFMVGFVPFVFLVGVFAALVVMQPDTGTAAMIILTTVTLFFLAGASIVHLFTMGAIVSVTGVLLVLAHSYRADRWFAFHSAEDDPTGIGFQIIQMLTASVSASAAKSSSTYPAPTPTASSPSSARRPASSARCWSSASSPFSSIEACASS
jgi:cell division protein FtsW (lipid II flippase)